MEYNELVEYVGLVKKTLSEYQTICTLNGKVLLEIVAKRNEGIKASADTVKKAQFNVDNSSWAIDYYKRNKPFLPWQIPEWKNSIEDEKMQYECFKQELQQAEIEHEKRVQQLEDEWKASEAAYKEIAIPIQDKLIAQRDELFNMNIIHPKYQNLVAICSIYEYLETGRCETLSGPDGAYNLYESEIRQDRIIEVLENINDNLEQIKKNQYVLYQAVTDMNQKVAALGTAICQELKAGHTDLLKQAQVNQYFAAVTAFNTSSKEKLATLGTKGLLTDMKLKSF